ncbi:unnamed protein product [Menidia menidia]|uniref:(Atlantic silverside) hypothetical protein n=1 Tax=Menidia menidia TaxID=238744 RepID=A0A8S4AXY9_9TELE|nr:unnamed protein product [Menidia menidia]
MAPAALLSSWQQAKCLLLLLLLSDCCPCESASTTSFPKDLEPLSVVNSEQSYQYPGFHGLPQDNDTLRLGLDFQRMLRINHILYIAARDHVFAVNLTTASEEFVPQLTQLMSGRKNKTTACNMRGSTKDTLPLICTPSPHQKEKVTGWLLTVMGLLVYCGMVDSQQRFDKLTWRSKDVSKCTVRGKNSDECYNYVKVLVPRNDETLFTCGTNAFNPTCRNYKVNMESLVSPKGEQVELRPLSDSCGGYLHFETNGGQCSVTPLISSWG